MAVARKPSRSAAPPPRKGAPAQKRIPIARGKARARRTPVLNSTIYAALIIALLFALLPTALILVVGGLPTLVAVVVDRHRHHYLTRCVGALNFAGVAPYLMKIWMHHTTPAAIQLLTNPYAWLTMYGAAGVGWIIYLSAPSIAWLQVELMGARRIKALKMRQRQLIEEWGAEVAEAAGAVPKAAGKP
jgi:hypothetical protein